MENKRKENDEFLIECLWFFQCHKLISENKLFYLQKKYSCEEAEYTGVCSTRKSLIAMVFNLLARNFKEM